MRMLERKTAGASFVWRRDSSYVRNGQSNVSQYTHQNFTPLAGDLSVTPAAPWSDSHECQASVIASNPPSAESIQAIGNAR